MPVNTHWQLRARLWWETVRSLFFQALKNMSVQTRHLFFNWVLKGLHYGNLPFMQISHQRCFMKALLNLVYASQVQFKVIALSNIHFCCLGAFNVTQGNASELDLVLIDSPQFANLLLIRVVWSWKASAHSSLTQQMWATEASHCGNNKTNNSKQSTSLTNYIMGNSDKRVNLHKSGNWQGVKNIPQ